MSTCIPTALSRCLGNRGKLFAPLRVREVRKFPSVCPCTPRPPRIPKRHPNGQEGSQRLVPALNNSKDYLVPASSNSKGYLVPALYNSSHNLVLATNDYNDTQPIHAMGSAAQRSWIHTLSCHTLTPRASHRSCIHVRCQAPSRRSPKNKISIHIR